MQTPVHVVKETNWKVQLTEEWRERLEFDREKFKAELELRRQELGLRQLENSSTKWNNPLVIAVVGATLAFLSTTLVSYLNGQQQVALEAHRANNQIALEQVKAESDRILEVIKSTDPQAVRTNLRFLLDTGLIRSPELRNNLEEFLEKTSIENVPRNSRRYIDSQGCLREPDGSAVSGFLPKCDEQL